MKSKYELRAFLDQFEDSYAGKMHTVPIVTAKETVEWVLGERDNPPQWDGIPTETEYADRLAELVPDRHKDYFTKNPDWATDLPDLGENALDVQDTTDHDHTGDGNGNCGDRDRRETAGEGTVTAGNRIVVVETDDGEFWWARRESTGRTARGATAGGAFEALRSFEQFDRDEGLRSPQTGFDHSSPPPGLFDTTANGGDSE